MTNKCSIVVLTGAGASQESGIETFRDSNGLWNNYNLNEVCRPESFLADPKIVLDFYNERRKNYFKNIDPNKTHNSLFLLEKNFKNFNIITQNVDDLHERAGNKNIWHVHGTLWIDRCHSCNSKKFNKGSIILPNVCEKCSANNMMRPDIVFFKERPMYGDQIQNMINNCHIFISIGTSGNVYPAASYGSRVARNGGITINVNKEVPKNVADFKYFFKGGSYWVDLISRLFIKNKR